MTERARGWRSWSGGAALLLLALVPLAVSSVRHDGTLTVHLGRNISIDLAAFLAMLPGVAAVMVLARRVGYRRRDALLMGIPVANVYIAWVVGARAAQVREPARWVGSREAAGTAIVLAIAVGAGLLAWSIIFSLSAMP